MLHACNHNWNCLPTVQVYFHLGQIIAVTSIILFLLKFVEHNVVVPITHLSLFMKVSIWLYNSTGLQIPHLLVWRFQSSLPISSPVHFRISPSCAPSFCKSIVVPTFLSASILFSIPLLPLLFVRASLHINFSLYILSPMHFRLFLPYTSSFHKSIALPAILFVSTPSFITTLSPLPLFRTTIYIYHFLSLFLLTPSPLIFLLIYSDLTFHLYYQAKMHTSLRHWVKTSASGRRVSPTCAYAVSWWQPQRVVMASSEHYGIFANN